MRYNYFVVIIFHSTYNFIDELIMYFYYRIEKKPGDSVQEDEVVCEIETDKTAMPVMAPASGVIEEFYVQNGDTVKAGQKIFRLKLGPVGAKPAAKEEAAAPPPAAATAAAPPPTPTPAAAAPPPPPPPPGPRPASPVASIPVAAIRHAQAIESSTVKVRYCLFLLIQFVRIVTSFVLLILGSTS